MKKLLFALLLWGVPGIALGWGIHMMGGGGATDSFIYAPLNGSTNASLLGAGTFARTTTGTYVDASDGLVKTAAINTPRFESNGLLMEGQATNVLLDSDDMTVGNWPGSNPYEVTILPTVLQFNAQFANHKQYITGLTPGAKYTFSFYARVISGNTNLFFYHEYATEGQVSAIPTALDGTLKRYSVTVTAPGEGHLAVGVQDRNAAGWGQVEISKFQLEASPYPTSYIPTTTASVTRGADSLYWVMSNELKDALSTAVGAATAIGTAVITWTPKYAETDVVAGNYGLISPSDAAQNFLYHDENAVIKGYDGTNTPASGAISWANGTTYKLAFRWDSTANTLQVSTATGGTWTHGATTAFDNAFTAGLNLNLAYGQIYPANFRNLRIYTTKLTDAQVEALP